jgi:hypothetical protein
MRIKQHGDLHRLGARPVPRLLARQAPELKAKEKPQRAPGRSQYHRQRPAIAGTERGGPDTLSIARLARAMTDARGSLIIHAPIVASILRRRSLNFMALVFRSR